MVTSASLLKGHKGQILLSGDGQENWFTFEAVINATSSLETDLQEIPVWGNESLRSPGVNSQTLELESYDVADSIAQRMIRDKFKQKEPIFYCYYPDSSKVNRYEKGSALVQSISTEQASDGLVTLNLSLSVNLESVKSVHTGE